MLQSSAFYLSEEAVIREAARLILSQPERQAQRRSQLLAWLMDHHLWPLSTEGLRWLNEVEAQVERWR